MQIKWMTIYMLGYKIFYYNIVFHLMHFGPNLLIKILRILSTYSTYIFKNIINIVFFQVFKLCRYIKNLL